MPAISQMVGKMSRWETSSSWATPGGMPGPAHDQHHADAAVQQAGLGGGEGETVVGGADDQRVAVQAGLVQRVEHRADAVVQRARGGLVGGHVLADLRRCRAETAAAASRRGRGPSWGRRSCGGSRRSPPRGRTAGGCRRRARRSRRERPSSPWCSRSRGRRRSRARRGRRRRAARRSARCGSRPRAACGRCAGRSRAARSRGGRGPSSRCCGSSCRSAARRGCPSRTARRRTRCGTSRPGRRATGCWASGSAWP